jgi:N-acetylmuramoyl-L-alanine amidase
MSLAPFKPLLAVALAVALSIDSGRAATPTANPPAPLPPTAIAVETRSEAGKTRLSFTLSKPVEVQTFVLERPDRVVIEFPEVNFQLPPEAGRKRDGLVASFRYGLFAAGRSRVVIDLVQPATVSLVEVTPRRSDGAVLVTVELTRTDRDTFRRATKPQEPAGTGALQGGVGASAASDRRRRSGRHGIHRRLGKGHRLRFRPTAAAAARGVRALPRGYDA